MKTDKEASASAGAAPVEGGVASTDAPAGPDVSDGFRTDFERPRLSLKASLIALLAVALMPAGGFAIGQAISNLRSAETLRQEADLARLGAYQSKVDSLLLHARSVLEFAVSEINPIMNSPNLCNAVMRRIASQNKRFLAAHVTRADGMIVCGSSPDFEPLDVRNRELFVRMASDPRQRMSVIFGRVTQRLIIAVTEPLPAPDGFRGYASISITLEALDELAERSGRETGGRFAIFDEDWATSLPLASGVSNTASGQDSHGWLPEAEELRKLLLDEPAVRTLTSRNGERYVYASSAMSDGELTSVGAWPESRVISRGRLQTVLAVALPLVTWALASAIAYFAVDRLVISNMRRLNRFAAALRRGDLGARAELSAAAPLEFSQLHAQFNEMAERIEQRDARLREAVIEERMLLREVYHRVKNNLQLIVSLLNLQARKVETEAERQLISRTQDRVQSLALVHQHLYQTGQISQARLDLILEQIVNATTHLRHDGEGRVTTKVDLKPVTLDADRAAPAALLTTEALMNAAKHGFPPGATGTLELSLAPTPDGGFELMIANTISATLFDGEPAEEEPGAMRASIGRNLMQGFARQLRGTLTQNIENGRFVVRLVAPPAATPASGDEADRDLTRENGGARNDSKSDDAAPSEEEPSPPREA